MLEYSPAAHGAPAGLAMTDVLHAALAARRVYVAHVPLAVYIGSGGQQTQPDTIAELYWDLYLTRDQPERLYSWT